MLVWLKGVFSVLFVLCSCLKLFHKAVLKCQVLGSIATGVQRLIVNVFVEANNNWHTHDLFVMCISLESMFYTHFPMTADKPAGTLLVGQEKYFLSIRR